MKAKSETEALAAEPKQDLFAFLKGELKSYPGRFDHTMRMTLLTMLTVFIAEVYRTPLIAYSAYIVFFLTGRETRSTIKLGVLSLIAATVAIFMALVAYTISAGEPALRVLFILALTFLGMYSVRISPLGMVGLVIGFISSVSLTLIDVAPTSGPVPSAEALTYTVLWLWVVVAIPASLVVMYNVVLSYFQPHKRGEEQNKPVRLLAPDAFSNPNYTRYALKVTLAVFIAYFTYNMLDWPGIRTCMVTCFFVAAGTYTDTVYKMKMRISGAAIGGGAGLLAVIFLMPYMTDIGHLMLMIGAWSLLCAWVATSSPKLAYVGQQMALAFFFATLVGYGPSIELAMARDRVVGIFIGNLIVYVIFSTLWPEGKPQKS